MLDNIVLGTKIELQKRMDRFSLSPQSKRSYISQVLDYSEEDEDELVCAMPIFEGRIIPLEVNSEYDAFFYTSKGIYKAAVSITRRAKERNIYTVNLKLLSNPEKFQRREYYRLGCTIEVQYSLFNEEETQYFLRHSKLPNNLQANPVKAIIVDISGGGVRVFTQEQLNTGSFIMLNFQLFISGKLKQFNVAGKIVMSLESPNVSDIYDTRIEFKRIADNERSEIVKYIFEQQRQLRNKERG
ncbi:MAG: flagellar brake domain-containing protein [Lachnospira sp.]|nr:flagellar brake domain-containing protein [Lachnospira sp.]